MAVEEAIFTRRTCRKFRKDPVPEAVVHKIIDAARYAPSSCNLQLWDFLVVNDESVKNEVAEETRYIHLAPVGIFVSYGNNYTRENYAWVQSAAAAIQNMMLMAHSLGVASCWVDTLGDVDHLRRILELPPEREILALVLFGYPELIPKTPRRREIDILLHYDHYKGRLNWPSSDDPEHWTLEQIRDFQMAKIRNGARYNKPVPSERDAILAALGSFVKVDGGRWLDVLPLTGLYTEEISRAYPDVEVTFTEMTDQVFEFVDDRVPRPVHHELFPDTFHEARSDFDVMSLIFRLEGYPRAERRKILQTMRQRIRDDGQLFVAFVNSRSYHRPLRWLRARIGHQGVEYALAPDPSLGPFKALTTGEVLADLHETGWRVEQRRHFFAVPPADEIAFRAGRKGRKVRMAGQTLTRLSQALRPVDRFLGPVARVQAWNVVPA